MSPSEQTPLRVGIIGLGYIGTTVGEAFHRHPDATVAALTDVDADALAAAGAAFSIPREARYEAYEEMLDREPLDALLVGTPHTLHYEQVLDGLDRGLDVLCDKPLTTDAERAREIVRRVEGSDRTLMVGYQRHLNPAFVSARERWRDPALEPEVITAEVSQNWIRQFSGTWRTDPGLSGGGNLYDTGSHLLDAVLWTTGLTPTRVSASMRFDDEAEAIDVRANLLVEFDGGATATITVYSDTPADGEHNVREHIRAWDRKGAVYLDGRQWEPRQLTEIDAESTEHRPYIDHDAHPDKAEAFVEAVRAGTEPPATARDALRVTAVTEAAYESAHTDEWVDVDLDV